MIGRASGPRAAPRVLVLSAFAPELTDLRRLLAGAGAPAALRDGVVCQPAGIGLVDAAVGASRALAQVGPAAVLFVGTAGSYAGGPAVGRVVVARRLNLVSAAQARGDGYLPPPLVQRAPSDAETRRALLRAAKLQSGVRAAAVDVATPVAITTAPALARAHARSSGAVVENLEAFAVARAAAAAEIPFGAVLGISNRVGPQAHAQWRRHQDAAMRAVAATVVTYLTARLTAPNR